MLDEFALLSVGDFGLQLLFTPEAIILTLEGKLFLAREFSHSLSVCVEFLCGELASSRSRIQLDPRRRTALQRQVLEIERCGEYISNEKLNGQWAHLDDEFVVGDVSVL